METTNFKEVLAQMQKTLECSICLELLTNPVSTRCSHQFCRFCIVKFLESKRSVPCPLCKVSVTKRGLQDRADLSAVVSSLRKLIAEYQAEVEGKSEEISPEKQLLDSRSICDENSVFYKSGGDSSSSAGSTRRHFPPTQIKASSPSAPRETDIKAAEFEVESFNQLSHNNLNRVKSDELKKTAELKTDRSSVRSVAETRTRSKTRRASVQNTKLNDPSEKSSNRRWGNASVQERSSECEDSNVELCTSWESNAVNVEPDEKLNKSTVCHSKKKKRHSYNKQEEKINRQDILHYLETGSCGMVCDANIDKQNTKNDQVHVTLNDLEKNKDSREFVESNQNNCPSKRGIKRKASKALDISSETVDDDLNRELLLDSSHEELPVFPLESASLGSNSSTLFKNSTLVSDINETSRKSGTNETVELLKNSECNRLSVVNSGENTSENTCLKMASQVSDVASTSSPQRLMKRNPVSVCMYSKDMRRSVQAGLVKNGADSLLKQNEHESKQCRGLTTKEKINAKKQAHKKDLKATKLQAEINSAENEDSILNIGWKEVVPVAGSEFQFELPQTPVPRRKSIFKSHAKNNQTVNVTCDKTSGESMEYDDPYEFKVGQTPVKHKCRADGQRGKLMDEEFTEKIKDKKGQLKKTKMKLRKCEAEEAAELPVHTRASRKSGKVSDLVEMHEKEKQEKPFTSVSGKTLAESCAAHFPHDAVDVDETIPAPVRPALHTDTSDIVTNENCGMQGRETVRCCVLREQAAHCPLDVSLASQNVSVDISSTVKSVKSSHGPSKIVGDGCKRGVKVHKNGSDMEKFQADVNSKRQSERCKNQCKQQTCVLPDSNAINLQSDLENVGTTAQKRKLVRRRRKTCQDSETFSQKSGKELARLIHDIEEAEDYELLFNTQDVQRKLLEDQQREEESPETFGFDTPKSFASYVTNTRNDDPTTKTECAKKAIESHQSSALTSLDEGNLLENIEMSDAKKNPQFMKDSPQKTKRGQKFEGLTMADLAEETVSQEVNGNSGVKCSDRSVEANVILVCHRLSEKINSCLADAKDTSHSLLLEKDVPALSEKCHVRSTERGRFKNYPRPNLHEMIQVLAGPEGIQALTSVVPHHSHEMFETSAPNIISKSLDISVSTVRDHCKPEEFCVTNHCTSTDDQALLAVGRPDEDITVSKLCNQSSLNTGTSMVPDLTVLPDATETSMVPDLTVLPDATETSMVPDLTVLPDATETSMVPDLTVLPDATETSMVPDQTVLPAATETSMVPDLTVLPDATETSMVPDLTVLPDATETSMVPDLTVLPDATENLKEVSEPPACASGIILATVSSNKSVVCTDKNSADSQSKASPHIQQLSLKSKDTSKFSPAASSKMNFEVKDDTLNHDIILVPDTFPDNYSYRSGSDECKDPMDYHAETVILETIDIGTEQEPANNEKDDDQLIVDIDRSKTDADHVEDVRDHNKAGLDHNKTGTDHNKAGTDYNKAGTDHNKSGTDHNKAGTDHNKAGTDHNKAGTDHNKAGTDHNKAGTDCNKAGTDHNKAGTEWSGKTQSKIYTDANGRNRKSAETISETLSWTTQSTEEPATAPPECVPKRSVSNVISSDLSESSENTKMVLQASNHASQKGQDKLCQAKIVTETSQETLSECSTFSQSILQPTGVRKLMKQVNTGTNSDTVCQDMDIFNGMTPFNVSEPFTLENSCQEEVACPSEKLSFTKAPKVNKMDVNTFSNSLRHAEQLFRAQSVSLSIPDTHSSSLAVPDTQSSGLAVPDIKSSGLAVPDTQSSSLDVPDIKSSGLAVPDTQSSSLDVPDIKSLGLAVPDTQSSSLAVPDIKSSGLAVPDTPPARASPSAEVSSAPSHFRCSNNEDEDHLIVRRVKRKCLSWGGTPVKSVIRIDKEKNMAAEQSSVPSSDGNHGEMIGETEAMKYLDTWTEQETVGDNVCDRASDVDCDSNQVQSHQVQETVDSKTESNEQNVDFKGQTVPHSCTSKLSLDSPVQFVEVMPIGRLKYIDLYGNPVVDFDEMTQTPVSKSQSERCLSVPTHESHVTRTTEERKLESTSEVQKDKISHISHDESWSNSSDRSRIPADVSIPETNLSSDNSDATACQGRTQKSVTDNSSEESRHRKEVSSDKSVTSGDSCDFLHGRHTKRGLAKRESLNLDPLCKHPKGVLSPASKTAIKNGIEKSHVSSPGRDKTLVSDSCADDIIVIEDDVVNCHSVNKQNVVKACKSKVDEKETVILKSSHSRHKTPATEATARKFRKKNKVMTDAAKKMKKCHVKETQQDYDAEKKRLERELFGSESMKMKNDCREKMNNNEDIFAICTRSNAVKETAAAKISVIHCSDDNQDDGCEWFDLGDSTDDEKEHKCEGSMSEKFRLNESREKSTMGDEMPCEDMKSSSSLPLTSSPVNVADSFDCDNLDQSVITAVDDVSDDDDDMCVRPKSQAKRMQIVSDSEDSVQEVTEVVQGQATGNNTSSCTLSSQSETLDTQQQEALEKDVAKLHQQIAEYETKLRQQYSSVEVTENSPEENKTTEISAAAEPDRCPPHSAGDEVSEDSNDLFVSPLSPSPPSHKSSHKPVSRRPAGSKPKRQTDQYQKQFQSPGGTIRTKRSLEFTFSSAGSRTEDINLIEAKSAKQFTPLEVVTEYDMKESSDKMCTSKSNICPDTKETNVDTISENKFNSLDSLSPVILSQKSRHVTFESGGGDVDKSVDEKRSQPKKDLCFVASGLGREELLLVIKLTEKFGLKFSSKFTKEVTHVVMKTAFDRDRVCDRTLKFFQGVAHKCWLVTFLWVVDSIKAGLLLSEEDYEILGDTSGGESAGGAARSRLSKDLLLSDFCFACVGDSCEMPKESLHDLLTACGAVIVDDPLGLLSKAAKYKLVVRCSDSDVTPTTAELDMFNGLYKHLGVLAVMREWVLDSLGSYRLLPLLDYVLNTGTNISVPF